MKTAVESFRDLRVSQAAMSLVSTVYSLVAKLPTDKRFGLSSQIRRSAVSVPSNIAEGHRRESTREYLRHLSIAQGSLAELETQLEIASRLDLMPPDSVAVVLDSCNDLSRQLFALRNSLERLLGPRPPSPAS